MRTLNTLILALVLCLIGAAPGAAQIVPLSQSGGAVCTNLSTPVITLYGFGSAPACPALWSELVTQTAAGTMAPVTAVTTATQNSLTALTTQTIAPLTATSHNGSLLVQRDGTTGYWCDTVACASPSGIDLTIGAGVTTNYTVPSTPTFTSTTHATGATATTYTWYYRICQAP